MTNPVRALCMVLLSLAAVPAMGAWEELRRNDTVRLAIDPASIQAKGDEVSFRYLVDFRNTQGDFKTAIYRSLATKAAIHCKARTIAARGTEGYAGNEAQGPMVGIMEPAPADTKFKTIEAGTSDEDLWKRVCTQPAAAAAKAAPAKK